MGASAQEPLLFLAASRRVLGDGDGGRGEGEGVGFPPGELARAEKRGREAREDALDELLAGCCWTRACGDDGPATGERVVTSVEVVVVEVTTSTCTVSGRTAIVVASCCARLALFERKGACSS